MKVKPLQDRIIVESFEPSSISKGGLIIPDAVKKKYVSGIVISVGNGIIGKPMTVKEGNTIYYSNVIEFEEDGKKYFILREPDVLIILDGDEIILLEDRILVKLYDAKTLPKGGIIIPDWIKEKTQKGLVVSVGVGKFNESMEIKKGDRVTFGEGIGTYIEINEEKYLLMRESDCLLKDV
jgi:chaperonin GroES